MTLARKFIFILIFLSLSLGLLYFAYLGYFTRFWQDDWCYNAHFQNLGFFETLKGYFYITTYASNRFSLTLFSGLFYYLGVFGVQILPGIVIVAFSGSTHWLLNNIRKICKKSILKSSILIFTFSIVFFTIFTAPDRFQSFYWRSAILPYTFPLIFFILLLAIITSRLNSSWNRIHLFSSFVLVSFFGSGFSEAGGAFIFTGLVIVLLVFLIWNRPNGCIKVPKDLIISISVGIIFSLLALIIMALSPANAPRQISYSEPSSLIETISLSVKFGVLFVFDMLKSYPLPLFTFFFIIFSISYLSNQNISMSKQKILSQLKLVFGFLLIALILTIALHAPSAYIEGNPPGTRTLVISTWLILVAISTLGWFVGNLFSGKFKKYPYKLIVLLILLGSSFYIIRAVYQTYNFHQTRFERIASVWDKRDALIKSQKEKGFDIVDAHAIDSQFLGGGILEWYPEPNWVNMCAAEYYEVKEIRATIDW